VSYVERVKGSDEISALNGLYGANRWLAFSSTILLVSLLGIPPLAGFWGKLFLFEASVNYPILLVLGLLNSAISAGYYLVIMREIFREGQYTKVESTEVDGVRHSCSGHHINRNISSNNIRDPGVNLEGESGHSRSR